ncbi:hypothetical protein CEUSTIGMA_g4205.t1 [Chlamydomonas eustigma]|uniref:Thiaminase-2/PQQC domain-containing protein n=1 Tax=Chlamydomonas eustigma TaxID=1157962 RepID=A0A250X109_9CHLO|nr:hypothetical protein CEUSTIGMA_g4205.t1 [Chlamydomonas eustigma]|eukprot:GAX76758.1 hypothetical protein CEUSTIGMA_g4205.t1 [Chlamydomonas eustigma]
MANVMMKNAASQMHGRMAANNSRPAVMKAKLLTSSKVQRMSAIASAVAPAQEQWSINTYAPNELSKRNSLPPLISKEEVVTLEAELDQSPSIVALRRFNDNLRNLPADRWDSLLTPVFVELCYNLESFNPAFTSCLLMVQRTIGMSDYVRRDLALKNLIQPLAGEYGMHNGMPQLKTHRELFSEFFASLFGYSLEDLMYSCERPEAALTMWQNMSRDITTGGSGEFTDPISQASYALGYNLAIEYLADYEKTWMLDSFRALDERIFSKLGKKIDWVFLEVHAEGEAEHAAIGHNAVLNFVASEHTPILRKAMQDHDRDFAAFYNRLADMLEDRA